MKSRRHFLQAAGFTLGSLIGTPAVLRGADRRFLEVSEIKRTTVRLPFRETPERAMERELPHWRFAEVVEVLLKSGQTGLGETLLFYTWGATTDEDVRRPQNRNAAELMWDDSLGAGLQMALFDAVAKTVEVPVHALLGRQVRRTSSLSWWNIDMPAADMAAECKLAYETGYRSYKTKGRPWFDVFEQMKQSAAVVPDHFKIDMDFNATLRDAERGLEILKDLEEYPQAEIFETPIPQNDLAGNRLIRQATRVNLAMHFGTPPAALQVSEGICDGFVAGSGGATEVMRQGFFSAEAGMPFWLQQVGSDITAAWSLHFAAVLTHAVWPAVNGHQLYAQRLLTQPITLTEGHANVPDVPGLGFELDRDTLEKFRVEKPASRPEPERLLETTWPGGAKMYLANSGKVNFMLTQANLETIPYYEPGADTRIVPNDGTEAWRKLYDSAKNQPVFEGKVFDRYRKPI